MRPKIKKLRFIDGAGRAEGLAVIIDVFRAFTTACYLFGNGACRVIAVSELSDAYCAKEKHPEYILIGERGSVAQKGFDYGNSPSGMENIDFSAKTAVLTTSSGTRGLLAARKADAVITGSFVNAKAVAEYARKNSKGVISLVSMGWNGSEPADEDDLCADHLENLILGGKSRAEEAFGYIRKTSRTKKFADIMENISSGRDIDLCLEEDKFDFVLEAAPRRRRDSCSGPAWGLRTCGKEHSYMLLQRR